ncbi:MULTISPECIES: CHAT domain-containing protein [unclassified Endozoicomonas]|uniref:CHAT domain-containing protein n=1 Tax=unclassified Endozoicomonas TaxID=2644528 RepID=UPI003BB6FBEF
MNNNQNAIATEYWLYSLAQQKALAEDIDQKLFDKHNAKGRELYDKAGNLRQLEKAKKHFQRALKATGRNAYAKSAVHHNMGILHNTHYARLPGGNVENLNNARKYLETALACKERQRFHDRYAYTLTQLAVTWRKAAAEPLWPDDASVCLKKAEQFNYEALEYLQQTKSLVAQLVGNAQVLLNLSSVLCDAARESEACDAVYRAFCSYMKACDLIHPMPLWTELEMPQLLGITFSRLYRLGKGQKHYEEVCDEILRLAPQYGISEEQLYMTAPNLDANNLEVECLVLIKSLGDQPSLEKIKKAKEKAVQLLHKRYSATTDQAADDLARYIQMLVSGVARGLCQHDMALEAFVELEHVSSMRFTEAQSVNWFSSENKLSLALYQIKRQLGSIHYALNEATLFYQFHDRYGSRDSFFQHSLEAFARLYDGRTVLDGTGVVFDSTRYPEIFREAGDSADPEAIFQQHAKAVLSDFKKVESKLLALEPSFKSYLDDLFSISHAHIEQVFQLYPELTLIKIDMEREHDDLLLIVIYLEKGVVCSKKYIAPAPSSLVNDMSDTAAASKEPSKDGWALDFVDWTEFLPIGKKQVGILPSYFASHIPWAATGLPGKRLLDLVDEVVWLPSILSLCHKAKHYKSRKSTVRISGGGTLFSDYAHTDVEYIDATQNTTEHSVLKRIGSSDVFSFYGHAEHIHPDRPKLLLDQFALNDGQIGRQVCGMSRVELWACQSGSNMPLMFMGSPVNEAFGMDMNMLEFGADTAIGTLWAVPELVTTHLKRYYDLLVSNGEKASRALLQAQRWWINTGADQQLTVIKKIGTQEYLLGLGYTGAGDKMTTALMGPVLAKNSTDDLEGLEQSFKHPSAWAGLRFCGLPENKSLYVPEEQVKLQLEDKVELERILNSLDLTSEFV